MRTINEKARPCIDAVRDSLSRLVSDVGELKASNDLGLTRLTIARAIAGLPLRATTRHQIETRLASVA